MSKFCGNCGTQLDDNAKVCGNCGKPLEMQEVNSSKIPGVNYSDPEKQAKVKKNVKAVSILAVIVIIAIIAIKIISGFVGYNGAVRKIMKAYEKYDVDAIASISSGLYDCFENEDYVGNYFENIISNDFDRFEENIGHNYKLDYEITDKYEMPKYKYEDLLDELSSYEDFDADVISKIMVVEVTVTAKEKDDTMTKQLELILTKEKGKWKILYMN